LFALSIGTGDAAIDNLYRKLYLRLANYYRATDKVHIDEADVLAAAGSVLKTDADFQADCFDIPDCADQCVFLPVTCMLTPASS